MDPAFDTTPAQDDDESPVPATGPAAPARGPASTPASGQPGHLASVGAPGPHEPSRPPPADVLDLFQSTCDLLATISTDGRFLLLNPAWEEVLGWTPQELMARSVAELVHPEDLEQTTAVILAGRDRSAELANFTNRYRHRDGSWRWLLWSARCDGERWHAAAKDVTDRMWLERQALHDPLTKLPNRLLLMDRSRQALARLHRSHGLVALLFVDLDRFKAINDNLGHALGDRLLVSVADRLASTMRDSDTVARLGGDEFVILAEDLESDAEAVSVAERVLHALEEPFVVGSAEVSMLASVGVSVSHDPTTDAEDLLREADVAMYRAKRAGGYGLELFDESLRREVRAHLDIESRLREAIPRSELALDYQAIVDLAGDGTICCEALLRWHPHDGASVDPAEFLPRAEESGLIVQIAEWALNAACAQAALWRRAGERVAVAVNVSPRGLTELDLAHRVAAALDRHGLPAQALWLEVTEEAIMRDPDRAQSTLREAREVGVKIALDGFGAGQSRLGLLADVPVDVVKIDRRLIAAIDGENNERAIVVAIVALAREANLRTVAVGIETARQLDLARRLGCELGQGFLLHAPEPPRGLAPSPRGAIRSRPPWRLPTRPRHRP